ncbi:hypothetical protein DFJ73DRAFT_619770 [Zopfochytrium polystomum]|nr:hypothetical protein DFJ73DRAFT_619770 [Zopfochytrium polystomum]
MSHTSPTPPPSSSSASSSPLANPPISSSDGGTGGGCAPSLPAVRKIASSLAPACDACSRKKIRCDGAQPSCSNCKRSGIACTHTRVPRKRGPKPGNVSTLESRLRQMEMAIEEARSKSSHLLARSSLDSATKFALHDEPRQLPELDARVGSRRQPLGRRGRSRSVDGPVAVYEQGSSFFHRPATAISSHRQI